MSSSDAMSKEHARELLAELDVELARVDARLDRRSRQRMAVSKLRAVCDPYIRDTPNLTVGEALALNRNHEADCGNSAVTLNANLDAA